MQHGLDCTWKTSALLLLCRLELLNSMPPWMGGGEMIQDVFLDHSTCIHVVERTCNCPLTLLSPSFSSSCGLCY